MTLLQEYLEHLLYGFDFVGQPSLFEREALFVPIGWDTMEKVGENVLCCN